MNVFNGNVLSSGNNTIGNVNIASELPAGSNTVGNVDLNELIPFNTVLEKGAVTATTTYNYTPHRRKISITLNITAVSGTSPTLNLNVYGIDASGTVLTGDPILSSNQYTSTAQQIFNIDLYGMNNIQIQLAIGGTSPSFTVVLGVSE